MRFQIPHVERSSDASTDGEVCMVRAGRFSSVRNIIRDDWRPVTSPSATSWV